MDLSFERLKLSDADGGGEDRLSALPDDVLIRILVLVEDAAVAARTSLLACRWRHLWTLLPELSFDYIEHHRIGAALAAHEASDLTLLVAVTEDASPESLSAWLPIAARALSGHMHLEVDREEVQIEAEGRGDIDLPCFEKATSMMLKLGFLGLTLPPSGVFARLKNLWLDSIQLHGHSGLGELLSSQRCPCLDSLGVCDVRGLDSFSIQSDSLLHMELSNLHRLQQLTVMAPALKSLKLDMMTHLKSLGIQLYILEGEEEAFGNTQYCMKLLQRFEHILTLDLVIVYPREICTGPYLIELMPRLPDVTFLALGVVAYGHSLGASSFEVLRRCCGVKELDLDFLPEIQLKEQTPCPLGCICDQPPNWRTEELELNCLEEIQVHGMRGTEREVALVQRLFHWATVIKSMQIIFHESIIESKAMELGQLLVSFSRPGIYMEITIFVP